MDIMRAKCLTFSPSFEPVYEKEIEEKLEQIGIICMYFYIGGGGGCISTNAK